MSFAWTDDLFEEAAAMWRAGDTAKEIAAKIGCPSRNAVIGKLHRKGLMGEHKPKPTKPRPAPAPASAPKAPKIPKEAALATRKKSAAAEDRDVATITGEATEATDLAPPECRPDKPLTLVDLKPEHCRWPFGRPGTPEFFFCGNEAVVGRPYCAGHCRASYVTPSGRPSTFIPRRAS